MSIKALTIKIVNKLISLISHYLFQYPRILKYKFLSSCQNITGTPKFYQPTQLLGKGVIIFGVDVKLGVNPSPYLYNGYGYFDARNQQSTINIGDNVWINNNCMLACEGEGIEIGEDTLIGISVEITDSDFHDLHPDRRMSGISKTKKVTIGKNVFIGSNVKVLKGVTIGNNSIIANSSIVTKSIPENVIAGGNPCKVIKNIDFN